MSRKNNNPKVRLSSAFEKRIALKKFKTFLASAPKLDFLFSIYSIHQIQNSRPAARGYFPDIPDEAQATDRLSVHYFHPWFLETLANEVLTAKWHPRQRNGFTRTLNAKSFNALARAYNLLNKAENACDGPALRRVSVLTQMNRLAKRQFEWQRRFSTASRLARYHEIYRTSDSLVYFQKKYCLEFDRFTKAAFAIYAMLLNGAAVRTDIDPTSIDLTKSDLSKTISILATSIEEAPAKARLLRQDYDHVGYAPSLFRRFPLIIFTSKGIAHAMCPIPDLLFYRITEGLFYDFVESTELRNQFSDNLESYVKNIISGASSEYAVGRSVSYGRTSEQTPDILIYYRNKVAAAIELKGRRQSATVRFSENPTREFASAYEEIAKGVFQIWKYVGDSRVGAMPKEHAADNDTVFGVCTLDNWIEVGEGTLADVYSMAHERADKYRRNVPTDAREEVPIFSIEELEFVISRGGTDRFIETLRAATTAEYKGWLLGSVFTSKFPAFDAKIYSRTPIGDIDRHVPWWNSFEAGRDS